MSDRKTAAIETGKFIAAWKKTTEGRRFVAVAVAMFRHATTTGLADMWRARQATWEPLSPRYAAWKLHEGKKKKAFAPEIWKMTGRTLEAISQNEIQAIGTSRGLRFAINFKHGLALARPVKFARRTRGGKWADMPNRDYQLKVLGALQRGNRRGKLAKYAEKHASRVERFDDRAGGGLKTRASLWRGGDEVTFGKREGKLPGRPLIEWLPGWVRRMEEDVVAAMKKNLVAEGLKPGG